MSKPLQISLLVPCYKAKPYLEQLARQIAGLGDSFSEVLLADDASKDGTYEMACEMGLPIHKLSQNLGPGGARNALAEMSKGDWIHFLDADDFIDPGFVRALAPLVEGADVVLCSGDFVSGSDGSLLERWSFDASAYAEDALAASFYTPVPSFCSLIRRTNFLGIGGFDTVRRCWEDGDLHLRLAASGARFRVSQEVLSISPRHDRGASGSHSYCHKCRLSFVKDYIERQLPIRCDAMMEELKKLGYLLLGAGEKRMALEAYSIAESLGMSVAHSNVMAFNAMLGTLPPRWSHCVSSTAKIAVSRVKSIMQKV